MVDIGRCSSCGTYTSEVWSKKDNCGECGGSMDHINVRLGPVEMLPRAFNIAGALVFLMGLVIFLVSISNDGLGSLYLYFMFGGIFFFVVSLVSQYFLVRKAIEKRSSMNITSRRTRAPGQERPGKGPGAGPVPPAERRVAKKVMIRK